MSLASGVGIFIAGLHQYRKEKHLIRFMLMISALFMTLVTSVITFIFLIFIAFFVGSNECTQTPKNRASAIDTVQAWVGLASLPKSASDLDIEVTGNGFTRGFYITFNADPKEIEVWLEESLETRGVIPQKSGDGSLVYSIQPRGGAQFAELVVSKKGQRVTIKTNWS